MYLMYFVAKLLKENLFYIKRSNFWLFYFITTLKARKNNIAWTKLKLYDDKASIKIKFWYTTWQFQTKGFG